MELNLSRKKKKNQVDYHLSALSRSVYLVLSALSAIGFGSVL